MAKLRSWVEGGGNLVLTDGALRAVSELTRVPGSAINERVVYVGQTSFQVCDTFNDDDTCETTGDTRRPAREERRPARRAFQHGNAAPDVRIDPAWLRDPGRRRRRRVVRAPVRHHATRVDGGRRPAVGGSANSGARDAAAVPERSTLGELALGQGKIRILGALLPQPSDEYDHPLGLEPYAVTYTGYILFCNLVDCQYERKARPPLANRPAPPGSVNVGFGAQAEDAAAREQEDAHGPAGPGPDPQDRCQADQAPPGPVPAHRPRHEQELQEAPSRGSSRAPRRSGSRRARSARPTCCGSVPTARAASRARGNTGGSCSRTTTAARSGAIRPLGRA